jgi:hypothetical protein
MRAMSPLVLALTVATLTGGCLNEVRLPAVPQGEQTPDPARSVKVIEAVRRQGWEVIQDDKAADKPIVGLDLHGVRNAAAVLDALGPLPKLHRLNLYDAGFGDADLPRLRAFPELVELNLNDTAVSDEGVRQLAELTSLRELHLARSGVTDAGLAHLVRLKNLEKLSLGNGITDGGLAHLKMLTGLRELHLTGSGVTDAGVAELHQALPRLVVFR